MLTEKIEQRNFFCAILVGDSVLDHCSCRGTKKVNVKLITSET